MKDISHLKDKKLKLRLCNISNKGRYIYLFCRDEQGKQVIYKDASFHPFYYEPNPDGKYLGYDGQRLDKIFTATPNDVAQQRSERSYSSDIRYPIVYITQRIDEVIPTTVKGIFIDIETLSKELPDPNNPKDVVSCITIYSTTSKKYKQFFLKDYPGRSNEAKERVMLDEFVDVIQKASPDLLLAWNISFDYNYLHNRIRDFAKRISPIGMVRGGGRDRNVFYPAGISIIDYMEYYKKVNWKDGEYKLDTVAKKHLGKGKEFPDVSFGELTDDIKHRNLEDVELMVKLEEMFGILKYFNEIRTVTHALWEDLTMNSKIHDVYFLTEARKMNIVLPRKPMYDCEEKLIGAYRRAEEGLHKSLIKDDVGSMYPSQIVNFCLDASNISETEGIEINGVRFKQNPDALVPRVTKRFMKIKQGLKDELADAPQGSEEAKLLQYKYDAYKGLVNSIYGVLGHPPKRNKITGEISPGFRLFDIIVANTVTFLSRDLIKFTESEMKKLGYDIRYIDTDALMYEAEEQQTDLLNAITQRWGKSKGQTEELSIEYENEGKFTKIIIFGKCNYYGILVTKKGTKPEIKGIKMKRSDSSKYEAWFQGELIQQVLDDKSKSDMIAWSKKEKNRIKTLPLNEISFPCKIGTTDYKVKTVFMRALDNSKFLDEDFNMLKGEKFFYVYVISEGKDEDGKEKNVLAFTPDKTELVDKNKINWAKMIERNIDKKFNNMFETLSWKQKNRPLITHTLF